MKIKTCLISVYDKTNILSFAQNLRSKRIEIISTGGTASYLKKNNINVTNVEDLTNFPEILDGRVKTLHPSIHGGLLAKRNNKTHMQTLNKNRIKPIDMVVINLYPFVEKRKASTSKDEIIEAIDIGGSTLIRAAAKNYHDVTIVSDPEDYAVVTNFIQNDQVTLNLRLSLALKAFKCSADYDDEISSYFSELNLNNSVNKKIHKNFSGSENIKAPFLSFNLKKYTDLRYGENPHQRASVYCDLVEKEQQLFFSNQIQGKELSYNNLIDADTAFQCVKMLSNHACVIIKHSNPCGAAEADNSTDAFKKAKLTDKKSSFGGIIAFNKMVEKDLANLICQEFVELIVAPEFTDAALKVFSFKPNIRIIKTPNYYSNESSNLEIRSLTGGYLIQDRDIVDPKKIALRSVTKIKPSKKELLDLKFAWTIANWVKSNAIVFCKDSCTLGIGAGQMSRFDSVKIAKMKAHDAGLSLKNSVVASDAFFPFRDGVDTLAEAGAKSIIQPGGSVKDGEVIAAANEHKISMVFTGVRHFRH